ncbi:MAG: class I SAM-dependent methyltransferase [Candidatus Krumholzibacteria bacterium]|nr:class I SAM-dependent methyltransferase [Candidatus Krumholzibacteria bacterium]
MEKKPEHIPVEQRQYLVLEDIIESLPGKRKWAEAVFSRLRRITTISDRARVLDVGAASGGFIAVCTQLGYRCEGVEPWEEERLAAVQLSEHLGIPIPIVAAAAESIPYDADVFDVVHASSVIEHVLDVDSAFAEAYRVLKAGGVFWFNTASSMCPLQAEIRGFPLFGWYPDSLKKRIMDWAKEARPHLVGHAKTPAINWFTPWKARSLLKKHGFKQVYDRWDLRGEDEGGKGYRFALRLIRSTRITKTVADVAVPGCSYAAIK